MKSIIGQDGTIGNTGDTQPDILPLTDFSIYDAGVTPAAGGASSGSSGIGAATGFAAGSAADAIDPITTDFGGNFGGADTESFSVFLTAAFASPVTYAPLVITPIFGASITNQVSSLADPTTALQIENAVSAAIEYYETNWTSSVPIGTNVNGTVVDTVSIPIQFDYGSVRGTPIVGGAATSAYDFTAIGNGSFGSAYAKLSGILPNLPIVDPTSGGLILETTAQSQLLGIGTGPASGPAGWIGLNTVANGVTFDYDPASQPSPGQVDAVGAIEHEISEVFGRVADLSMVAGAGNSESLLDLYRFSGPNTFATAPGRSDYFSLNEGTTSLGLFNDASNNGDAGDWATSVPPDNFDAFLTRGAAGTISNRDTMALSAIGLQENPRTLVWTGDQGSNFATAADWNDLTSGLNPGQTAPGAADTAQFLAGGGTITGSGTASVLQFGGTPLWNVTGGASLNALTGVTVGQGGGGSVLINGGASVSGLGSSDTISGAASSVASVTVDGVGSNWNSAEQLTLGDTGTGNLTVSNGAHLTAAGVGAVPALVVGAAAGAVGTLSVTGAGSLATVAGQVVLGDSGSGTLTIANHGTVITGGGLGLATRGIAVGAGGGSASIQVTGTQSLLVNTDRFIIGESGLGRLGIDSGGTVMGSPGAFAGFGSLLVADGGGSSGSSVSVTGSNSRLSIPGLVNIGFGASGALQVSNGATVTADSLDAGVESNGVGQIGLTDAGTNLSVTGSAIVGDAGIGALSVLGGATLAAGALTIGAQSSSPSTVFVSGMGSAIDLSGALNIGTAQGIGVLTIGAGAVVSATAVNLSNGQVVMQGGVLDPVVVNITSSGGISGTGTQGGDIVIDNGTILANGSKAGSSLLTILGTIVGGGTLTITGGTTADGTTVNSPGLLQLSNIGTLELKGPVLNAASTTFTDAQTPTGTYTVTNSVLDVAFAAANEVLVLDDIAGFAGTITTYHIGDSFVVTGGTLSNLGVSNGNTLTVQDSSSGTPVSDRIIFGSAINAAMMHIQNGNTIAVSATVSTGATLEITSGPLALTNFNAPGTPQYNTLLIDAGVGVTTDPSDVLSGVTLINNGTINPGGLTITGPLQNNGSITGDVTLASGASLINTAGGTISGSGLAAVDALGPVSVTNAGLIDPASYGVDLTAGGTVVNTAGATIEGTIAGVLIAGGPGTLTNAGTIIGAGGGGDAVILAAGFANRVILNPGAAFTGLVDGGNTIGAGAVSTLELALAGGTLFGFGAEFVNFAQVTIDPGALWKFVASNNLGAGTTLTDQGQMLVVKGAVVTGGAVNVASTTGITASGTVSGGNWSGMSRLDIGGDGEGSFLVNNGGTATAAGVQVAANSDGSGDIVVTGTQSLLASTGSIMVGDAGLGGLSISAGGSVTAGGDVTIANTGSASGSSVNVTGAASNLQVAGRLVVGGTGFGQLSISQSSTVTAGSADEAALAGSDGAITVTDAGSALNISGLLTVGDQSAGSLNIVNGASVTVGGLSIGTGATGSGNVVIGPGSHLTLTGVNINVGLAGSAVLDIQGGTLGLASGTTLSPGTFGRIVQVGGLIDPATVFDASGGSFGGGGTAEASGTIVNSGQASVTGGAETLLAPLITSSDPANAAGVWSIKSGGTLVLDVNTFDNSQTISFGDLTGVLTIGQQVTLDATQTPVTIAKSALDGFAAPIVGYKAGDKITFLGLNVASDSVSGNVVTLFDSGNNNLGSLTFQTSKGGADTNGAKAAAAQMLPCFAEGTRIETASGFVKVEMLCEGELVVLADGGREPVVWIGQRLVDCGAHPKPETVWPVRIAAGSFGENVPVRDLYLSPDHAVFVNEVLVPVKLLVNGTTIVQVKRDRVRYFHVELPRHAVILAEGLTVESYLDVGDRANFDGSETIRLFPEFDARLTPDAGMAWETRGAARLVMAGPELELARRHVAQRTFLNPGISEPLRDYGDAAG